MQNRTLALGLIALSLIPFSAAFVFYERPRMLGIPPLRTPRPTRPLW